MKETPGSSGANADHAKTFPVLAANIPVELTGLRQWVVWRAETSSTPGAKPRKMPYQPKQPAQRAASNRPAGWATFDDAYTTYERSLGSKRPMDGIGFMFTSDDAFVGLDFDDVFDADGEPSDAWSSPERQNILQTYVHNLPSYVEVSPSGCGYKAIVRGNLPPGWSKRDKCEVYDSGRYFTLTGHVAGTRSTIIGDCQSHLDSFRADVEAAGQNHAPVRRNPRSKAKASPALSRTDRRLLALARRAANGDHFWRLFNGETSRYGGDRSAADMALANMLVFWTNHDLERADRLFRDSKLMRPKWDEEHYGDGRTYGRGTLEAADETVQDGYSGADGGIDPDLPDIVADKQPRVLMDQAMQALERHNEPPVLFVRGGHLARVRTDELGQPIIDVVTEPMLKEALLRSANWLTATGSPGQPSKSVVDAIHQATSWNFPTLRGVTDVPLLGPNGELTTSAGYDPVTKVVLLETPLLRQIQVPAAPTMGNVQAALRLLDDLFGEFSFLDESSWANFLALILTPAVRHLVEGPVMMALLTKPVPGSGATLLIDCLAMIHTGEFAETISYPSSDEEMAKVITAVLARGRRLFLLDNVDRPLEHSSLAGVLTANRWSGRVLGFSMMLSLPVWATFVATGNNIQVRGDIGRRTYEVRLDPADATPHLRDGFRHPNLLETVKQRRGEILSALLTLVRYWFAHGAPPPQSSPLVGRFEGWCEVVGGVLECAEVRGFLGNFREGALIRDPEVEEWAAFLSACSSVWPRGFQSRDLTNAFSTEQEQLLGVWPEAMTEALSRGPNGTKAVGKSLASVRDRLFQHGPSQFVLRKRDVSSQGITTWTIDVIEIPPSLRMAA